MGSLAEALSSLSSLLASIRSTHLVDGLIICPVTRTVHVGSELGKRGGGRTASSFVFGLIPC